jgi:predicted nuclease of predicted toxin-antitoxin system
VKLLIDMNLSPLWVAFLQSHGIDALHWSSVGSARTPDNEILQFAVASGWIVFTHDLDFGALLATSGARTPSVLQVRGQDVLPSAMLHVAHAFCVNDLAHG